MKASYKSDFETQKNLFHKRSVLFLGLLCKTRELFVLYSIFRSSDCNYEHLEQLLDEEWRRYINKIVMTLISVTKQDYNSFCRGLDHDEKVKTDFLSDLSFIPEFSSHMTHIIRVP